jgi:hypothetical protein
MPRTRRGRAKVRRRVGHQASQTGKSKKRSERAVRRAGDRRKKTRYINAERTRSIWMDTEVCQAPALNRDLSVDSVAYPLPTNWLGRATKWQFSTAARSPEA